MTFGARVAHLVMRFFRSLGRAAPDAAELASLEAKLTTAERHRLDAMSAPDRRHAVSCAVGAERLLGAAATTELVVASAMHDVGKTEARLGTVPRAGATVLIGLLPQDRVESWLDLAGWRRSVAQYAHHDSRGAALLEADGSAAEVVIWAREHHLEESAWSLPPELARPLAQADLLA